MTDELLENIDNLEKCPLSDFRSYIEFILDYSSPPDTTIFNALLTKVLYTLQNEEISFRPKDDSGRAGGLIEINKEDRVIILPDLHARRFFMRDVLHWKYEGDDTVLESLENKCLTLICVGDGVHGEAHFARRWKKAYDEFMHGYKKHESMDEEITDSFNLMLSVILLKIRFKERFHFLKGNHENIYNETGGGNFAFAKYSNEGAMTLAYFQKFFGAEILELYAQFEASLPLFVVGNNFLVSHAEPEFFFNRHEIINVRDNGDLIEALTWTDNYASDEEALNEIIDHFIPQNDSSTWYFGGHRPIKGLYNRINGNRYVQIHNPRKEIAVVINQEFPIDLDQCVKEISLQDDLPTEEM